MKEHHHINYIEFTARDLPKIKDFYNKAFGWQFADYGPDYVAFTDGVLEGGFALRSKPEKTNPLVILYSKNLEESQKTIEACGGVIVKPIFDFPGGKRFHFTDPAGNELAVWSE